MTKARIFATVINKGGTLKTTSSVSLAGVILGDKSLNIPNKKILLIDLDTQGNAASAFGKNPDDCQTTIYDVLLGNSKAEEAIVTLYRDHDGQIDLIPANDNLSMIEMEVLTNLQKYGSPLYLLQNSCGLLVNDYDYIIFDTPPHMGMLVLNVLAFNVGVPVELLIPFQPENFGFRSLTKVINQYNQIKKSYNPNLTIAGIFGTLINEKTNIHGQVLGFAKQQMQPLGHKFCNTYIPQSIQSANSYGFSSLPVTLSAVNKNNQKLIHCYQRLWGEVK